MDSTVCAAADAAAPRIDDPLAANAPNPACLAGALDLAEEARVFDLARAIADPERGDLVSALLCHELASCHRLMMRFGAMADHHLSHTSPTVDADRRQVGRDAIGFAAIAARLMARYRQAALALPKLRADVMAGSRRSSSTGATTRAAAPATTTTRSRPIPPTVRLAGPAPPPPRRSVAASSRTATRRAITGRRRAAGPRPGRDAPACSRP